MAGDAPEKKVIFSKYELGRLLGRGSSAKVYHARDVSTGKSVAVKCIAKRKPDLSSAGVVHEISVMSRLRHPNVVRPIEVLSTRRHVYLVMELAKGGELFSRLAARGRINEDLARRYFRQLVSAVGYCHSRGVFHRDIKPENLLLDEHGVLKVSDFGLSGVAPAAGSGSLLNTFCGTPAYVAPEILAKKAYDGAGVDVWSCGVVLFVLVAGYLPFNDPNLMAMYRKIYRGEYRSPKWFSPELLRLVSRLLDTNPVTRITVDGILHDPWFRNGLAETEWQAIARFHRGEGEEKLLKATGEGEERELNAFDIISFSPALDLSGMFEGSRGRRERLVCAGQPEGVAERLEAAGKGEGLEVTRKGTRLVMREARGGRVVAAAAVHRLAGEMAVVEVAEGGGGAEHGVWERLQAAMKR